MDVEVLKQKILDLAIRGKLVPQDPNDEPASALLEKIKAEKAKLVKEGKIKASKEESYIYKGSDNCYYEKKGNVIKNINDEISIDIPDNWAFVRIGDYAKTITDFVASGSFASLRQNVKYYKEPNYAVMVRTCDFKIDFRESLVYTDKHGYEFLSNSNLFGGEILLSNIGASIGKIFIVPKLDYRMTLAPNSIMVKFFDDELREYFYYLFLSSYGQKILNDISASSAQAKFNKTDFKQLIIPIPPLNEQLRIGKAIKEIENQLISIQKEYDDINNLVDIAKAKVLESIFSENSSYKSYYTNKKLSQISKVVFGQSPSGKDIIPYFSDKGTEFHQGKLSFGIKYLNNSKKYCTNPKKVTNGNSILMSVRAPVGDINLCNRVVCIGRGLCSIEPEPSIDIEYLFYYLLTQKNHLLSEATGSTFSAIKSNDVKNINVPICSLEIQGKIVLYIKQSFHLLDVISS